MTSIAEIAEREATEAEAEFPDVPVDPETGGELEPVAESEPERQEIPTVTRTDEQEREKKLKAEDTRHENALKKIYGDDFVEHAFCPLCIGQGFLVPIPAGEQPDEIWEAVKALSGRTEGAEYNHPDELVVCKRCDGWGKVASGAKNETNAVVLCSECDSRGYFNTKDPVHRAKLGLAPPEPTFTTPAVAYPTYHAPEPPAVNGASAQPPEGWHAAGKPGADAWDRWPGHNRYGIDPANGGW